MSFFFLVTLAILISGDKRNSWLYKILVNIKAKLGKNHISTPTYFLIFKDKLHRQTDMNKNYQIIIGSNLECQHVKMYVFVCKDVY